ncbi:carboxypeptidase-like regulatory domain-containing protein [uncultured Nonlabens sp.]|uniref:carboxypeptidase-like regulatory domain-containing protein n=1 Tax=uncultured Nonlabens sp. TaxID=859306 RepID=UPI0026056701|nr:carboxypeptidase-like regulatory domain-containing protein [uncultured Nonlabens sp.]
MTITFLINRQNKKTLICLFLFFTSFISTAQISGIAVNEKKEPVAFATVILKTVQDSSIVAFTQTDKLGFYKIKPEQTGAHLLTFSSLSYAAQTIPVTIKDLETPQTINISMVEQQLELNEVIINADLPIRIKKDTIIIDAKAFMQGNEEVVEDLLKKIPGLTVETDGTIKIGNQEVEKVMVEGDDFFEKGYKILTKNMPAKPLNKIEVLKHYSNNKLLKGVEESDKVALNLTLDEDAKRQWFGNIELGQDLEGDSFYQARFNLMSFGKKNKFYFLGNANSTGQDATGDIGNLISPMRYGEPGRVGDGKQVSNLQSLEAGLYNFKASRSNFNNAELLSLNAIFNPTEKLKIKTLGFFNWDEKDFFRNSTSSFFGNNTNFTNTEDYLLRNRYFTGFGKFQLNYDMSKTSSIESVTSYSDRTNDAGSNLQFNDVSTVEALTTATQRLDHITTYTNRFDEQRVLLLTGRFIDEKSPQNYDVNQYFFQDLFNTSPQPQSVFQNIENSMTYAGFNAHYLDRKKNGHLLEMQLGNEYREDRLGNELRFRESGNIQSPLPGYENDTRYSVNDLYAKAKYLYKWEDLKLTGAVGAHQLFNNLEQSGASDSEQPFFMNPRLDVSYKINRKNRIGIGASHNTTNAGILDVYDQYVLTSFRSLNKGTGDFNQLEASSLNFNYQLGNWSDQFFASLNASYRTDHDYFSTNSLLQPNFSQTKKIVIEDRENLNVNAGMDYYFGALSSNLKLKAGYSESDFKNILNNSSLREVESANYNLGLEMRSAFDGIFNYHIGTTWAWSEVESSGFNNSFVDNNSFLDLSFVFSEQFDMQVKSERYFFGNINDGDNTYYFLDLDARYNIKDSPLSFSFTARNLTNTERFRTSSINDVSSSTVSYRLLPRYLLLNVKYRF